MKSGITPKRVCSFQPVVHVFAPFIPIVLLTALQMFRPPFLEWVPAETAVSLHKIFCLMRVQVTVTRTRRRCLTLGATFI